MSVVATALVLGALVVLLLRVRAVRFGSALVCVLFGMVVGLTPVAPTLHLALDASGGWLWTQVSTL
jgi:hypothetical protein